MTVILADIGGTHARLSLGGGFDADEPFSIKTADHKSFDSVLEIFCEERGLAKGADIYLGTAARKHEDGKWRFTNGTGWIIDPDALAERGWRVRLILNDLAASMHGALAAEEDMNLLAGERQNPELGRLICGVGTGLGLAYAQYIETKPQEASGWHVQETFGGHMLAPVLSDEHMLIREICVRQKENRFQTVVAEDLVGGRGLPDLYNAVCLIHGYEPLDAPIDSLLLNAREDFMVNETLRFFHELLGLFLHQAVLYTHATGGITLTGGVIDLLHENALLDIKTVQRFLRLQPVPIVAERLSGLPIFYAGRENLALHGLAQLAKHGA